MQTHTVDSYASFTGEACLHGTIAVTITGLSLTPANVHTLQLCQIGNGTTLAAAGTVTVSALGVATADLVLESTELTNAMGARHEINGQLYLYDADADIAAWNGQIKIRWAPTPTGYVVTTPGTTAATVPQVTAAVSAHNASGTAHSGVFEPANANIQAHVTAVTGNPHAVTAAQAGAYRHAATTAVGNVSGSVTSDFAASLTNTYTLTGNCTALPLPTDLADGETGVALFTLAGFSMPAAPASTAYKGNWTVTGTVVRVIWERIGALYFCTADSLTVVA